MPVRVPSQHYLRRFYGYDLSSRMAGTPVKTVTKIAAARTLVTAMAKGTGDSLVVVGDFSQAGGVVANHVALWNGTAFQALGTGITASLSSVAVLDGVIYVGGSALSGNYNDIGIWNGSQWNFENAFSGNAPAVHALFVHDGVLYASGTTMGFAGSMQHVMSRGPGGEWQFVGSNLNGAINALGWHNGHLVVGGEFTAMQNGGGTNLIHVAMLENGDWSPLGMGLPDAVSALLDANGILYAGGHIRENGAAQFGLARFGNAGNTWEMLMPNAADYISTAPLNVEVRALAQNGTDLFLGGDFQITQGGTNGMGVAKFNGSADAFTPYADLDGPVQALACNGPTELIAGGTFQGNGNESVPHIGHTTIPMQVATTVQPAPFGLFPNPAGSQLTVTTDAIPSAGTRIEVVDAHGAVVAAATITSGAKSTALDVSTLPPGAYIVRLLSTSGPVTRSFVKQ